MAVESMSMEMEKAGPSSVSRVRPWAIWLPRRRDPVPSASYASSSISTSGTTLSTLSHTPSSAADEVARGAGGDLDEVTGPEHVQDLVLAFGDGGVPVLQRWLSQLGVASVLRLTDDSGASRRQPWPPELEHLESRWTRALTASTGSILHALVHYVESSEGQRGEDLEHVYLLFVRFAEVAVLKMLPVVTAVCSMATAEPSALSDPWAVAPARKLQALIDLAPALETAKEDIALLRKYSALNPGAEYIDRAFQILDDAIWDTIDDIRTGIISSKQERDSSTEPVQERSPHTDDVTPRYVLKCIRMLTDRRTPLCRIIGRACEVGRYVPRYDKNYPFTSLIVDMVSCLEEKLAEESRSFPDPSLRFLFLLNNTYFIWQQLDDASFFHHFPLTDLARKIDDYIQKYLQVSWEPVVSCLHNPTPQLCLSLGRSSPVVKFESEFQKTYNAQKLWKVPDPRLRTKLRGATIKKVTSGYTKYLEDNSITAASVTPQELKEMLYELFEG
ncbi:hypothetical protein ACP4OV_014030 [Aristida adscensionis]